MYIQKCLKYFNQVVIIYHHRILVVIFTEKRDYIHSDLRFCTGSNPPSMLEVSNGENNGCDWN